MTWRNKNHNEPEEVIKMVVMDEKIGRMVDAQAGKINLIEKKNKKLEKELAACKEEINKYKELIDG